MTLTAHLRHFVQPEALAPSEAWVCSNCKRRQPAVKQMSLRRAPPVLCMHVKRFEHCPGSNRILKKLQAPLAFPTGALDLYPYLTATILTEVSWSLLLFLMVFLFFLPSARLLLLRSHQAGL